MLVRRYLPFSMPVVLLAGLALASPATASTASTSASPAAADRSTSAPTYPLGGPNPPVPITVTVDRGNLAPGYTFVAPKALTNPDTTPSGPEIVDEYGRPVWWHQVPAGSSATDFRVQTYRGRPVLTWNEGHSTGGPGHSEGIGYVADTHYRTIATVRAGNGYAADQHEFQLTPRGTALITIYHTEPADLRSVGGPADGLLEDSLVQEIDVRTGRVLFQWDAKDHVPFADSYQPLPANPTTTPWDFFHVNAVHEDTDGNLLVDARHTWTVYKVQRHSGEVLWQLGGKHSTFHLGRGVRFAWQHDPEAVSPGVIRIFDNESNGTSAPRPQSRVITVRLDTRTKQATLVSSLTHPDHLLAPSQGNAQLLSDGHRIVNWGALGRISEFDRSGRLIFDAQVPAGDDNYRAYRSVWSGTPLTKPSATIDGTTVHAIWNGATRVRTWQVYAGPDGEHLRPVRAVPWNGLDTGVTLDTAPGAVRVVALDAHGRVVGRSATA